MNVVNKLGRWVFGTSSKDPLIEIPDGQLYVVRPLSPKGYSELIYKDAQASIRRTAIDHNFHLVITRAYQPGEAELLEEELGDQDIAASGLANDEQIFLLGEELQFRVDIRDTGEKVFAWRDLTGSSGDLYEFVCDNSTSTETAEAFELKALRCLYERKFKQSSDHATEDELAQFLYQSDEPIPPASPSLSSSAATYQNQPYHSHPDTGPHHRQEEMSPSSKHVAPTTVASTDVTAIATPPPKRPTAVEVYSRQLASLHRFDFINETFVMQDLEVAATVTDVGNWNYWLEVSNPDKTWISCPVDDNLTPVFNREYFSFIFNVESTVEGQGPLLYSWLLKFGDPSLLDTFEHGVRRGIWEHNNHVKWSKISLSDQDYITMALQDLEMKDADDEDQVGSDEEGEQQDEEEEESDRPRGRASHRDGDDYDTDDETNEDNAKDDDGNVNSQLAVGQKTDRAFVVRGHKLGVFKHNERDQLEFVTNISKIQTPKGKLFSPTKVMLHAGDSNMILKNKDDPNSVYRLDLEAGKIVEEWKVHDDIPINLFAPESKFAQASNQQTFLGLSNNAMYRVDPRLAGNKLVDTDMKQYQFKTAFSTIATTGKGYIAVGSANGEVRMFDRLGVIAKTALPSLGNAIVGLDVSADGRWLLATTSTYLLLVDTLQKDGKFEGKLGFEKSFPKGSKPQPRRLALTPSHVAQFFHETKQAISFTPAKFNAGPDTKETTIVSSTGPFVVTWSLTKLLKNSRDPYSIKRYNDEVKADNFRFDSDKGIIVALPNEVDMVMKKALQKPTRESIAPSAFAGRRSGVARSSIVNAPY